MVEISYRVELQYEEEPPGLIPKELIIVDHGKSHLKLRPTSKAIVQLICGPRAPSNASISSSLALQKLLEARNGQIDGGT